MEYQIQTHFDFISSIRLRDEIVGDRRFLTLFRHADG